MKVNNKKRITFYILTERCQVFHSRDMAKRKVAKVNWAQANRHLLIPAGIGGLVAWIFSDSFQLGALVFVGVWVGMIISGASHKK